MAVGSSTNNIHIYSFSYGVILFSFAGHDDYIPGMVYAQERLVSYGLDMVIKCWDLSLSLTQANEILETCQTIYDHQHQIMDAAWASTCLRWTNSAPA